MLNQEIRSLFKLSLLLEEGVYFEREVVEIGQELKEMVGARGFEPPASWSRTRRSSQAEPRPEFQCGAASWLRSISDQASILLAQP